MRRIARPSLSDTGFPKEDDQSKSVISLLDSDDDLYHVSEDENVVGMQASATPTQTEHPQASLNFSDAEPHSTDLYDGCIELFRQAIERAQEKEMLAVCYRLRIEQDGLIQWKALELSTRTTGNSSEFEARELTATNLDIIRGSLTHLSDEIARSSLHSVSTIPREPLKVISEHMKWLQKVSETLHDGPAPTQTSSTSHSVELEGLTPRMIEFCAIPATDHQSCQLFVRRNSRFFNHEATSSGLLSCADTMLQYGREAQARKIIDRYVMFERHMPAPIVTYIQELYKRQDRAEYHYARCERIFQNLLLHLPESLNVSRRRHRSDSGDHTPDDQPRKLQLMATGSLDDTIEIGLESGEFTLLRPQQAAPRASSRPIDKERMFSSDQNDLSSPSNSRSSAISAVNFHVQGNPRRFFIVGRVIKVLWHQPAGEDPIGPSYTRLFGMFKEPVQSSIKWMIVVVPKNGYSLCCPISTYGSHGLARKNLKEEEIRAHAIVYAEGESPARIRGEANMTKKPIAVKTHPGTEMMHPASRIHFGKIHTLEWNVKVMNIGMVSVDSIQDLIRYFTRELNVQIPSVSA